MLSKNNHLMKQRLISNAATHQRFGLRKLSIGVASVLLSTTFFLGTAHADAMGATVTQAGNTAMPSENVTSSSASNLQNSNTITLGSGSPADSTSASTSNDSGASSSNNESTLSSEVNSAASESSSQNTPAATVANSKRVAAAPASETPAEQASATIVYREGSKEVGTESTISGTVGQTVDLTLNVPSGYSLVPGVTVPSTYTFTNASEQYIYIPVVAPDHRVVHADETKSLNFTFNYEKVKVNYGANGLPTGVSDDGRLGTNNDSLKFTYTYTGDVLDASDNTIIQQGLWEFTSVDNQLANDPRGNDGSNGGTFLQGSTMYLFPTGKEGVPSYSNHYNGWLIGPNISDEELSHYYLIISNDSASPYSLVFDNPQLAQYINIIGYLGFQLQLLGSDYDNVEKLPDTIGLTLKYLENPSVVAIGTDGQRITTLSPLQLAGYNGSTGDIHSPQVMIYDHGYSDIYGFADTSQWAGYHRYTGSDVSHIIEQFGDNNGFKDSGYTASGASFDSDSSTIAKYDEGISYGNGFTLADGTQLLGPVYVVMVTDPQSVTYRFVDTDNNNAQVGSDHTYEGKTDQPITLSPSLSIPEGYELADGQTLPTSYTFKATNQPIVIRLKHQRKDTSDTDPQTTKTVTRTIIINNPVDGTSSQVQTVTLHRTASYDVVTGQTSYGVWSVGEWAAVAVPVVAGYTASQAEVPAVTVTGSTADATVVINYTGDEQTNVYRFVDTDNNNQQVGSDVTISGKTGQTVALNISIPEGYELADGQTLPTSYTFKATNQPIVIRLKHQRQDTSDTDSQATKTVTRTIIINNPVAGTSRQAQTVTLHRTASYDAVTGQTTYGDWSTGEWAAVAVPVVAGYTASQAEVPQATVTGSTTDTTVVVNYTANDQTNVYRFVDTDNNDQQVGSDVMISGRTGQTIALNISVPEGYELADGQTLPTSYTFEATNQPIVIRLKHQRRDTSATDPQATKTVTRTIIINNPVDGTSSQVQTVTLHRTASYDVVTGQTSYGVWSVGEWAAVAVPVVAGYTASQTEVPQVTVNGSTTDTTVVVNYTGDDQTNVYRFVDADTNQQIGSDVTISGKTGQTIALNISIPDGYELADGQTLPTSYTFKANNEPIIIRLKSQQQNASGADSQAKRPDTGSNQSSNSQTGTNASPVVNNVQSQSAAGSKQSQQTSASQLPQTGNDHSEAAAAGLMLVGLTSMFGLAKRKKRN
jgi:LPXTG-motif cell wall-anchored protein